MRIVLTGVLDVRHLAMGVLAFLAGCRPVGDNPPSPPAPDTSRMEQAVAAKIDSVRAECVRSPRSAEAWGKLGIVFEVHELTAEAVISYTRAGQLNGGDFRWPYFAACCLLSSDPPEAIHRFAGAAALKPDHAPLQVRLADALVQAGRTEDAVGHYERALALQPSCAFARLGLARIAGLDGRWADCLRLAQEAIQFDPDLREAYPLLSTAHRRAGDQDAAAAAERRGLAVKAAKVVADPVRDALGSEGVSASWHARRGDAHLLGGRADEAIAEFRQAVEIQPDSALFHYNLGAALAKAGKSPDAIQQYLRALQLRPDYAEVHYNYGTELLRSNQPLPAAEAFRKALASNPTLVEARSNLGVALLSAGQVQAGIVALREAIDEDPNHADWHLNLAKAAIQSGDAQQAAESLEQALRLDPEHLEARVNYGHTLARLGRQDRAVEHFRGVLQRDPQHPEAYNNLGSALTGTGAHCEAVDVFREGLRFAPDHPGMRGKLAWLLAAAAEERCRHGAEAVRLAEALCEETQRLNPAHLDALAAAYAELGDFVQAEANAQDALTLIESAASAESFKEQVRQRLELYLASRAYRLPTP